MNTLLKTHHFDKVFTCLCCGFRTSGIILVEDPLKSNCPRCKRVLVWCQDCGQYLSSEKKEGKIRCGKCNAEIPDENFNFNHLPQLPTMKKHTVLSGIRATGRLHFGNFLGAVANFVQFQGQGHTCLYFIADLHTLTTLDDPEELRGNVLNVAKDYLAAGLDPMKSTIYVQSSVPEIIELMLYLGMFQPLGDLMTVPTYKDLVKKHPNRVSHGLLTYPVLMAADILGPQSTLIPVGEDQVPNVELARSLARRFNTRFGETFVIPEMMHEMIRIPGLDGGKMGKSDAANAISIDDPIEVIRERYLKHGVTDPLKVRRNDPGDPYNRCKSVYPVHEVVTPGEKENRSIAKGCLAGTLGCRDCKMNLVDNLAKVIGPFQEARRALADQDDFVRDVLHEGGKRARAAFQETLESVRSKIGIRIY